MPTSQRSRLKVAPRAATQAAQRRAQEAGSSKRLRRLQQRVVGIVVVAAWPPLLLPVVCWHRLASSAPATIHAAREAAARVRWPRAIHVGTEQDDRPTSAAPIARTAEAARVRAGGGGGVGGLSGSGSPELLALAPAHQQRAAHPQAAEKVIYSTNVVETAVVEDRPAHRAARCGARGERPWRDRSPYGPDRAEGLKEGRRPREHAHEHARPRAQHARARRSFGVLAIWPSTAARGPVRRSADRDLRGGEVGSLHLRTSADSASQKMPARPPHGAAGPGGPGGEDESPERRHTTSAVACKRTS